MLNVTNIPAARVPFIEPETNLMTREWYRFFYNIFLLSGAGSNQVSLSDLQVGPPAENISAIVDAATANIGPDYQYQYQELANDVQGSYLAPNYQEQIQALNNDIQGAYLAPNYQEQIQALNIAVQSANLEPRTQTGTLAYQNSDNVAITGGTATLSTATIGTVNATNALVGVSSAGNVLVGQSSPDPTVNGWSFSSSGVGTCKIGTSGYFVWNRDDDNIIVNFRRSNSSVGTITVSTTGTAYNTSSDYRLKHSVRPLTTGLATITALKPSAYQWRVDDSFGEGFIAHELAEVVPAAVHGEKDAADANENPIYQGVDYSKLVVYLVAAVQELSAQNNALAARISVLETS